MDVHAAVKKRFSYEENMIFVLIVDGRMMAVEENHYSGPNHMTLRQGRENYLRCGRCERKEFNKLSAKDFCI